MLEVGWPDPALVLERIESTRNWRARSAAWARSIPVSGWAFTRNPFYDVIPGRSRLNIRSSLAPGRPNHPSPDHRAVTSLGRARRPFVRDVGDNGDMSERLDGT